MGYNAGGYGTMTFPDEGALASWKKATVSHAEHGDWVDELDSAYEPDETVAKRLARIAKGHKPKDFSIQEVSIDGLTVTLTWDTNEDSYREGAGDFAALVRSAEKFGAKGTFYFLGTAGAEEDFAYSLVLDGKKSKVAAVPPKKMKLAYGEAYEAFSERVSELVARGNPTMRKLMATFREGTKPSSADEELHHDVVNFLVMFSDAQLVETIAKYPVLVPTPKGPRFAKEAYPLSTVRKQFQTPKNEETRAVALWVLGELRPDTAIPIAFARLKKKSTNEHLTDAALRVLVHDDSEKALQVAVEQLKTSTSVYVLSGAQSVLMASKNEALDATLESLLDTLSADRGGYVVAVLNHRKKKHLKPALARYARRTKDRAATLLLSEWR